MIVEDQTILQEMVKEKVLTLKRGRKISLKKMVLKRLLIPIIQNILVKKE